MKSVAPLLKNEGIQILRAIAANAVVLRHIQGVEQKFGGALLPGWFDKLGSLGVALFFVISGYVIIHVAQRESWGEFLYARVTRIYPAYWIYTTALLCIYLVMPGALSDRSGVSLIGSYLLWPTNGGTLLAVGWTLVHEMYFYIVIAAMIALRLPVICTLVGWAAVVLLWPIPATGQVSYVVFNPMTLLFIAGALLRMLTTLPDLKLTGAVGRVAVLLGDASYSTYLSHVFVVSAIWRLVPAPSVLLIAVSLISANIIGVLSYWCLERPILKFMRARSIRLSST